MSTKLPPLIDCHCHILPRLDDGASSWEEAVTMARLAVEDGVVAMTATPHQLGAYEHITPCAIRQRVAALGEALSREKIPLDVRPGAHVHAAEDLADRVARGEIMTLADQGRHLLVQIPHAPARQLVDFVESFRPYNMQLILTQPERNRPFLRQWDLVEAYVDAGFLVQVTAGALSGAFGVEIRSFGEWLVQERLVHLIASDGHGASARRPLLSRAYHRVCHLTDAAYAAELFSRNPHRILQGKLVPLISRRDKKYRFRQWFRWRRAA